MRLRGSVEDTVLGRPRKKNKPWISRESWSLMDGRTCRKGQKGSERVKGQQRKRYKDKDREVK